MSERRRSEVTSAITNAIARHHVETWKRGEGKDLVQRSLGLEASSFWQLAEDRPFLVSKILLITEVLRQTYDTPTALRLAYRRHCP